jgi:hypothetical protein
VAKPILTSPLKDRIELVKMSDPGPSGRCSRPQTAVFVTRFTRFGIGGPDQWLFETRSCCGSWSSWYAFWFGYGDHVLAPHGR